eukprot:2289808-Prymnesium_polylepis.1
MRGRPAGPARTPCGPTARHGPAPGDAPYEKGETGLRRLRGGLTCTCTCLQYCCCTLFHTVLFCAGAPHVTLHARVGRCRRAPGRVQTR